MVNQVQVIHKGARAWQLTYNSHEHVRSGHDRAVALCRVYLERLALIRSSPNERACKRGPFPNSACRIPTGIPTHDVPEQTPPCRIPGVKDPVDWLLLPEADHVPVKAQLSLADQAVYPPCPSRCRV